MIIKTIGLIIFILGLVFTLYTGLDFVTKEKVEDARDIQITLDKKPTTNLSPLYGIGAMIVGVGILVSGKKIQFKRELH